MTNKLDLILEELLHEHCRNCNGAKPLVEARDEEILAQARQKILECVPSEDGIKYIITWGDREGYVRWGNTSINITEEHKNIIAQAIRQQILDNFGKGK